MDNLNSEIEKKLLRLVKVVNIKNKMNLNDINSECEKLFCEILNILFGLDLVVLNTESNYRNIAVDLGDEKKSFYAQVTSNKRKHKIEETLRKFSYAYGGKSKIIIFIIGKKPKYGKFETYGIEFDAEKDIWDIDTIINNLHVNPEQNRKVLFEINKFYDSGITDVYAIDKKSEDLTIDKTIIDSGNMKKYSYGLGDVCVDAFLPKSYKDKLSLLLTFRKKEVEDALITFGQEDAQNILFCKDDTEMLNRKFILFEDEGKIWLQLLNIRFPIEYSTAENLCFLLDDLKEEFNRCLYEQEELLGTTKFNKDEDGDIVLAEVPIYVWETMVEFARHRDYGLPYDKWNIFYTNSFYKDRIMVYKNINVKAKGDVLTQLFCKKKYGSYVTIVWRPGFTALDNPCKEFDNIIKWKADYTCDWLVDEFIPRALFEKERKWYQTYDIYKKKFYLRQRNIYCLKE